MGKKKELVPLLAEQLKSRRANYEFVFGNTIEDVAKHYLDVCGLGHLGDNDISTIIEEIKLIESGEYLPTNNDLMMLCKIYKDDHHGQELMTELLKKAKLLNPDLEQKSPLVALDDIGLPTAQEIEIDNQQAAVVKDTKMATPPDETPAAAQSPPDEAKPIIIKNKAPVSKKNTIGKQAEFVPKTKTPIQKNIEEATPETSSESEVNVPIDKRLFSGWIVFMQHGGLTGKKVFKSHMYKLIGCNPLTYSGWESGKLPSNKFREIICKEMPITEDELAELIQNQRQYNRTGELPSGSNAKVEEIREREEASQDQALEPLEEFLENIEDETEEPIENSFDSNDIEEVNEEDDVVETSAPPSENIKDETENEAEDDSDFSDIQEAEEMDDDVETSDGSSESINEETELATAPQSSEPIENHPPDLAIVLSNEISGQDTDFKTAMLDILTAIGIAQNRLTDYASGLYAVKAMTNVTIHLIKTDESLDSRDKHLETIGKIRCHFDLGYELYMTDERHASSAQLELTINSLNVLWTDLDSTMDAHPFGLLIRKLQKSSTQMVGLVKESDEYEQELIELLEACADVLSKNWRNLAK